MAMHLTIQFVGLLFLFDFAFNKGTFKKCGHIIYNIRIY